MFRGVAQAKKLTNQAIEYALTGDQENVCRLIQKGADRDSVVEAYAQAGYVDRVNFQVLLGARKICAVLGFFRGGHLKGDRESVLHLLSHIHDIDLRSRVLRMAKTCNKKLDTNSLAFDSSVLNALIKNRGVGYLKAKEIMKAQYSTRVHATYKIFPVLEKECDVGDADEAQSQLRC